MHTRSIVAALVVGATAVMTIPTMTAAQGEQGEPGQPLACGTRTDMIDRLQRTFGEVQTGLGMISEARVLEVWTSEETGTWTLLMTDARGQSCMVAAGEAWKTVPIQAVLKGEPT